MKRVSTNVYMDSETNACNLGLVTTKDGIVLIDTPALPTNSVKWREEAGKRGEVRYLIIREEHGDHSQGGWFFPGTLIASQVTREKLSKVPVDEVIQQVKLADPKGLSLMKSFRLRLPDIAFTGSMDLYLGGLTFNLFSLPGHSPGGIGVYIPEERVVFTPDCIFHRVKSWLQDSTPDQWLESLKKIAGLDVDMIVPGHGTTCKKDYIKEQAKIVQQWVEVAKSAIKQGLSVDEAVAKISAPDPYSLQSGTALAEADLNKMNFTRLYQLYSK